MGPNQGGSTAALAVAMFQSSVRINVGPNSSSGEFRPSSLGMFQSSVRINVGPNRLIAQSEGGKVKFQSSVRINVGPNPARFPSARPRG